MRAVLQRVSGASVEIDGKVHGAIGKGILALVGVHRDDLEEDARYILDKILDLRIFPDAEDRMNLSLRDVSGALLLVSQFTLLGDCRRGRRPSYSEAMEPARAEAFFARMVEMARSLHPAVETGRFKAMMDVALVNEGPVTLIIDSRRSF